MHRNIGSGTSLKPDRRYLAALCALALCLLLPGDLCRAQDETAPPPPDKTAAPEEVIEEGTEAPGEAAQAPEDEPRPAFGEGSTPYVPKTPAGAAAVPPGAILGKLKLPAQPKVMVIPLNDSDSTRYGMIDMWQAGFVKRRLAEAKAEKYDAVILEIDTNGGMVLACEEINKAIQESGVPAIAFVRGKAFSGGAIISLGCDVIVMAPGSQIGGAQVVGLIGDMPSDMREKGRSMLVAMVRGLCERNGHPRALAEGMVDREMEVLETNHPTERFVTSHDMDDWKKHAATRGPVPTVVKTWKEADQILTLSTGEALATGLAAAQPADRDALYKMLAVDPQTENYAGVTAGEKTARFLGHPGWWVLMVVIALAGIAWEFKSPGLGVGALVAAFALGLFFWLAVFADSAGLVEIILFLLGAILIGVEIFALPGFGVCGISGIVCILASLMLAFIPDSVNLAELFRSGAEANPFQAEVLLGGLQWASITLGVVLIAIVGGLLAGARLPGIGKMALKTAVVGVPDAAARGAAPASAPATKNTASSRDELVGKTGVADTALRPSGKVRIDGMPYEATSETDWIQSGQAIRVIKVNNFGLVVRAV